jgi:hypothetical protein
MVINIILALLLGLSIFAGIMITFWLTGYIFFKYFIKDDEVDAFLCTIIGMVIIVLLFVALVIGDIILNTHIICK